jgi:signal transduction histidine kinase
MYSRPGQRLSIEAVARVRVLRPYSATPIALQQVVWNVLSNAVKFPPAGVPPSTYDPLSDTLVNNGRLFVRNPVGVRLEAANYCGPDGTSLVRRWRQISASSPRRPIELGRV